MKASFKKYGVPLCCGVLLAFAFPTFQLYPLAWFILAPLFYRWLTLPIKQALIDAALAGIAFHLLLLQWLSTNIYWAGGWATLGYMGLVFVLSLFWIALAGLWRLLRERAPGYSGALVLASLWVLAEWLTARLFTGFGWSALGYSQGADLPILQWASLGGVGLISFLLILVNALLALALYEKTWRWQRLCTAFCIPLAAHLIGYALLEEARYEEEPFTAGLVQTDFPLEMKWDWDYTESMLANTIYQSEQLARHTSLDCIFWPEAAIVRDFSTPSVIQEIQRLCKTTQTPLFSGAVRHHGDQSFNSSVLMSAEGEVKGYYDKVHLAPFGEYLPLDQYLPFLKFIVPVSADAGEGQKVFPVKQRSLGPLICFEVLFAPLAETLRDQGADCLVVLTNLAWFGASNAIPQEFELARMRAVETRLPLIHCANTGISGVFDPYGRFSRMQGVLSYDGQYRQWRSHGVSARATMQRRCLAALPVAEAGKRYVPKGPVYFPILALMLVVGMSYVGVLRRKRASAYGVDSKAPQPSRGAHHG